MRLNKELEVSKRNRGTGRLWLGWRKERRELNQIIDLRKISPADIAAAAANTGRSLSIQRPLDPRAIAFITAVTDEAQYRICLQYLDALQIPSGYDVEKIAVFGGASMPECYQRAMDASTARYKIYLHVDTYVVHRGLLPDLLGLFDRYPRLGLVGVVGSTRLPPSGIFWVNNPMHSYGRLWQNSPPGFPGSAVGPAYNRRLHSMRFRSFVGDYLPAAIVDGFFMATQYDIPWIHPQLGFDFGFDLYDHSQALEFIKEGLEVGIARQETIWCVHRGPLEEPSGEQQRRREIRLRQQAEALRQLYPAFVGVPTREFSEQHRGVRIIPREHTSPDPARDRLGVVIVTVNGREVLLRALRALLPQCDALKEVDYQVVVVDDASTDGTVEAVRREFPEVSVIANHSDGGPARAYTVGLRHLGFPTYIMVMHDSVEVSAGTLARMVRYLKEHLSTAGVVGSLIDPDGRVQFQRTDIVELVPRRHRRLHLSTFVGTTCAIVRGEVFFDVGLYDERLRVLCGDLDWSLRARRKGYRFAFLPEARVIRHRSMGSRENRRTIVAERFVDNLWLTYKHGGRRWAIVLYGLQRLLAKWFEFRWRDDREALRQLGEATASMKDLYRRFRAENQLLQRFLR
jgi:GT2 family glycosyltransferase